MNEEILKQFEQRMIEGFASVKEQITKSEDINKERMAELRRKVEEQEKRINKLENSVSYNVGKIAGSITSVYICACDICVSAPICVVSPIGVASTVTGKYS